MKGKGFFSLEWSKARSKTLLLFKPAGEGAENELNVSHRQADLTDIAPTMLANLGLAKPASMTGENLLVERDKIQSRVRDYYFYKKKGAQGWTDEMAHYEIEGDQFTSKGLIKLKNNKEP